MREGKRQGGDVKRVKVCYVQVAAPMWNAVIMCCEHVLIGQKLQTGKLE